jgi:predicted TIM-barrel fold metal-dependent hydrolase
MARRFGEILRARRILSSYDKSREPTRECCNATRGGAEMIIDAQVHVWLPDTPDRPWAPDGAARAQLPYALDYNKLLGLMDEAGVDRAVLVPPSWEGNRNDHALEAAARYPNRFAVMGRMALDQPGNAERLRTWKSQPGMLGIRQTFVLERERKWMTDGTADWFWDAAETAGIPVMLHATGLMKAVGTIAERHPDLTLILDHFGLSSAAVKQGRTRDAIGNAAALAKYDNVYVKVSAAPVYSSESYPFRDMDEHIKRMVDAYGPKRCFWGTDLSHALGKVTYRQCVTHFTEALPFLSDSDKDWIMGRSLAQCLGWPM